MPETTVMPAKPKPKGGRIRRALRWAGLVVLLLAIFHRPIFHFTLRLALRAVAARMHVDLDLHTSGTIFTSFTVEDVRARPTGRGPTPIAAIDIAEVRLHYSLSKLARRGIGEFLDSYEIHRADLDLVAMPSRTKKERREKVAIARQLHNILGQPAAYADRVWIEDFNIKVTAPENVTEIRGVNLRLDPEKTGYLQIARLAAPGIPVWENLSATTTYARRNFFIKDLRLAPELSIDELNFDASQRAQNKGAMSLRARAFGGTLALDLAGTQLGKRGENLDYGYATALKIESENVAIDRAADYFGAPVPPVSRLTRLTLLFTGEPERPRTWRGNLSAGVAGLMAGAAKIDGAALTAVFDEGVAEVRTGNVAAGRNRIVFDAKVGLPESVNDFARSDIAAAIKIDAPDLQVLTAAMPKPLSGRVTGGGSVVLRAGRVRAEIALDAENIANDELGLVAGKVAILADKQLEPRPPGPFDGLAARVTGDLRDARFKTITLDSLRLDTEARNRFVTIHDLEVHRAENYITAKGSARIPEDPKLVAKTPVDGQFEIHLPNLAAFGIEVQRRTLSGRIEGAGNVRFADGVPAGDVQLDGSGFQLGDFTAVRLAAKVAVADGTAVIDQLALQLGAAGQIVATGKAGIAKPFAYDGSLLVDLKNLAALQPLLALFGKQEPLAGSLQLQWNGKGAADPPHHQGQLALAVDRARFGNLELHEARLGGHYTPDFAESKPFKIVAGATSLGGVIEFRDSRLRLKDLQFEQAGTKVLSGYIFVPFNPANTKQPIPLDQRIAANINAEKLDVEKLLASFGQPSPVSGSFTANIVAGGTLLQPFAHLKLIAERLQARAARQFDPGGLALDLHYSNKELTLAATLKQPQIQPLTLQGRAPLDLEAMIETRRLDPNLSIEATAHLPPSALSFLPKVVPQVRRIDGTAALDVRVGGTVGKPVLTGSAAVELKGARMLDENIPPIGAFSAKVAFADDVLDLQRFEGEVGGGRFKLGGSVGIADPKNPVFALRLESDEVLVKRDDSITIRADADVSLDGALNTAALTGALYVVHSRFFREIDILPIALPGKPKPVPKVAQTGPSVVSIPQPPLRDWTFDLAIKTREDDPFLIRGNLANGAVSLNLRLAGTGLAPYLEGTAKIERFVATLPFSTLSITSGFLAFTKDQPFQPSMELQAESRVRDYLVRAFIYGKATEPQVQLNSEPPLPHGDIVSLLATGTTTAELAGSADALASRAAMLAVKQLYQKIFKRGSAPPPEERAADSGSFMDRFEVELGALSNRSSGQDVKARFKVSDRIFLIGDLGVDGNFTGSLKYLIRFR